MVNGKPGDHPYLDMVAHKLDCGEPEIAARLRKIDAKVDLDVKNPLSCIVGSFPFRPQGLLDDYRRQMLLGHLDTIERLCAGRRRTKKTKATRATRAKSKPKKKELEKTKKKSAKRTRR